MINNDEPDRYERNLKAVLAEFAEFQAGFRRNQKANLSRHFDGQTVAVFRRPWDDDSFGWSIADPEGDPDYSPEGYNTEEDAMFGLGRALGFGV